MTGQVFNQAHSKNTRQRLRNNSTAPEQALWKVLKGKQLGVKFRRQHGIGSYIVDFYCAERGLVIELDGESHFIDGAPIYDKKRDSYLQALGLRVMRFTNVQIKEELEGVYEAIAQALRL